MLPGRRSTFEVGMKCVAWYTSIIVLYGSGKSFPGSGRFRLFGASKIACGVIPQFLWGGESRGRLQIMPIAIDACGSAGVWDRYLIPVSCSQGESFLSQKMDVILGRNQRIGSTCRIMLWTN